MATKTTETIFYCPINPSNSRCSSRCAWNIGNMCSVKIIADRLFHISIDSNDIAEKIEEYTDYFLDDEDEEYEEEE